MQNKKTETLMLVLSILTVVLVSIGLTFAYFSVQIINGNSATATITTAAVGDIIFEDGAEFNTSSGIKPDWRESKDITLTFPPMFIGQEVYIDLDYKNNMPELTYSIEVKDIKVNGVSVGKTSTLVTNDFSSNGTGSTSTSSGTRALDSSNTNQNKRLVKVNSTASDKSIEITYTYTMELPETGVNQDQNQGKHFTGTLSARMENEITYYTNANPTGTTVEPKAVN